MSLIKNDDDYLIAICSMYIEFYSKCAVKIGQTTLTLMTSDSSARLTKPKQKMKKRKNNNF
jgi:hypothetical protein